MEKNGWSMRTFLAITCLALVTATLAGCAEDAERYPDGVSATSSSSRSLSSSQSTTASTTSSGSTSNTTTGQPLENEPPTGTIAAAVNGTNATFSLDGSDPDGDVVVWELDFGDGTGTNGTALPATVNHTYVAGNYTANFTVTDGKDPVTYDLAVPVGGGGGGATGIVFTEAQATPSNPANSVSTPAGWCGASCCASFTAGMSGGDCVFFELDAAFAGHPYTATADDGDPDLDFWPECDASGLTAVEGKLSVGPESGVIPAGAGCVVLWAKAPPAIPTHTFTVF